MSGSLPLSPSGQSAFPAASPAPVGIERIAPLLRGLSRRLVPPKGETQVALVILASGQLQLEQEGEAQESHASPMIRLFQNGGRCQLVFGPGASGYVLAIPNASAAEIAGRSAEAVFLQDLLSGSSLVQPRADSMEENYLMPAGRIEREVRAEQPGAHMAVIAWTRLLLVNLWREAPSARQEVAGASGEADVIRSFRRLVELHFRHHLGVADYARQLGVGYDRLHGICQRKLGRTPLQLIHQRLLREAVLRIERTDEPIAAIAWSCGFNDANNFSRFFRRGMGQSPLHYRAGLKPVPEVAVPDRNYADWP